MENGISPNLQAFFYKNFKEDHLHVTFTVFFKEWYAKIGPAAIGAGMPAPGLIGTACAVAASAVAPFS